MKIILQFICAFLALSSFCLSLPKTTEKEPNILTTITGETRMRTAVSIPLLIMSPGFVLTALVLQLVWR